MINDDFVPKLFKKIVLKFIVKRDITIIIVLKIGILMKQNIKFRFNLLIIKSDTARCLYTFNYLFWHLRIPECICHLSIVIRLEKIVFQKKLSSENLTKETHRSALVAFAKCTFVYYIFVFTMASNCRCYMYRKNCIFFPKTFSLFDIFIYIHKYIHLCVCYIYIAIVAQSMCDCFLSEKPGSNFTYQKHLILFDHYILEGNDKPLKISCQENPSKLGTGV